VPPKTTKAAAAPAETADPQAYTPSTEDHQVAAEKRAAATKGRDHTAEYIGALLEERRGYVTRGGMDDRVAQVDEQIRLRGGTPPTD
jgi:hypothetical protein